MTDSPVAFGESAPDVLFRLTSVSLRGQQRPRLDDVSLQICSGVTAIVGYSGAGKTSLLNLLAGYEQPDQGQVTVAARTGRPEHSPDQSDGRRPAVTSERSHGSRRLPVFWAPQGGGLWPHLTVQQHLHAVDVGGRPGNLSEMADEILTTLDLKHRRDALPGELSQGERSRLSVARALVAQADVLLLDEPFAHVDTARRTGYWHVVRRMTGRSGGSLVFASHEPSEVIRESQRVICLDGGRVIYQGATRPLYQNPPDRVSGEFLGRLNWFDAAEFRMWFSKDGTWAGESGGIPLRPEFLEVVPDPASEIEVLSTHDEGAFSETELLDRATSQRRQFLHCSGRCLLQAGERVRLNVRGRYHDPA